MYFVIHKQKHSSIALQVVKLPIVIYDGCLKALKYSMHT